MGQVDEDGYDIVGFALHFTKISSGRNRPDRVWIDSECG